MGAGLKILASQISLQRRQRLEGDPVNAIHWTGINRFLNAIGAVSVLTDCPGTPQIWLYNKGVTGYVGAVTTTDAFGLIDPDSLLAQSSTKHGLITGSKNLLLGWSLKSE